MTPETRLIKSFADLEGLVLDEAETLSEKDRGPLQSFSGMLCILTALGRDGPIPSYA
jgi:hypothetical protein